MSDPQRTTRPPRPYWPRLQPRHLTVPKVSLWHNLETSAARYPDKPAFVFYDSPLSFSEFKRQAERIAGYLQKVCGVKRGDRVLLYAQNSPQFALAWYGILRADAAVVPVNPMNKRSELAHYVHDTGARVAFAAQDLIDEMSAQLAPELPGGLERIVSICYADALHGESALPVPDFVSAPRRSFDDDRLVTWQAVMDEAQLPGPHLAGPDDLAAMPYTSGTTGQPKGCMHTHASLQFSLVSGSQWFGTQQDAVMLSTLPWFHVTGMQGTLNGPIFTGATVIVLPRWDRETALRLVQRHRVTNLQMIAAMVVDMLAHPQLSDFDLGSLRGIRGGGAAMPEAVAQKLFDLTGLEYVEGYGMSETMAATHINPPDRPKKQCLGIALPDVDARVVDPETLEEVALGDSGEIVVSSPNVMKGYWKNPSADRETFFERDGKRFLRTGDLGRVDEEGYFFMVDRLKRMINASGFKVWPAEVEALLYRHPAIREACVIATPDPRRGETVKACIVLRDGLPHRPSAEEVITWAHEEMAAYKVPRVIEFVDALPKSPAGKVQWRMLQEAEYGKGK